MNTTIEIEEAVEAANLSTQTAVQENNRGEHQLVQATGDEWEQLSKEKAAAVNWQPKAVTIIVGEPPAVIVKPKIQTGMVAVVRLRPYAKNAEIYHEREDALLLESIRANGVRNDLLADEDGIVYGGTTRLRYAREIGLTEVPVKVIAFQTEDEKLLRLLDDNLYRRKTNEETVREYMARKAIESRAAILRKAEAGKKHGKLTEEVKPVAPVPAKKGKARDLASEGAGRTGVSLEKGCKVIEAADKLREEGDGKTADELIAKLDKEGYTPALKYGESLGVVPKPKPKGGGTGAQTNGKKLTVKPSTKAAPDGQDPATNDATELLAAPVLPRVGGEAEPITDAEDHPPVVNIITACDKLADDLDDLVVGDLKADQKGNLYRVLERVANWLADHDQMLQVLAQK